MDGCSVAKMKQHIHLLRLLARFCIVMHAAKPCSDVVTRSYQHRDQDFDILLIHATLAVIGSRRVDVAYA